MENAQELTLFDEGFASGELNALRSMLSHIVAKLGDKAEEELLRVLAERKMQQFDFFLFDGEDDE